jgi:4-amino-4-deoxy-L-arabinose transferase-like glycosyltransferase
MDSRPKKILIVILAVSVLLRILAALYLGNRVEELPGTYDQISYHTLALRVLNGYGFTFGEPWWPATAAGAPTAHWSYPYVGFLVGIYGLFGPAPLIARLIQAILVGILQPYVTFLLARRVFNQSVGLASAAIAAVYGYFIYYAANLMTEPFYITTILASLYLAVRLVDRARDRGTPRRFRQDLVWGLAFGLVLGAAVLFRQLFLLIIPFIFLWVWWVSGRRQVLTLLISGVVILSLILPFTLYNYARFERFVLLNTNAGFAFYWANHPIYGTHFVPILPYQWGTYQDLIPRELLRLDEAALDQALLRLGIQFVIDDPARYLLLSLSRIPPYFMFWPSSDSVMISNLTRVFSFGLALPFMLYGLAIAFPRQRGSRIAQPVMLLYLFAGIYTLIHILIWALIRYRLPVDAVLVVFAGFAVVDLAGRVPVLRRVVQALA